MDTYYAEDSIVFFDGKFLPVAEAHSSLYSQTLHYGNGVFEGIRSYKTGEGTHIFKAEEHYARLLKSAERMHIPTSWSVRELVEVTYQLLEKNKLRNAYIRPLLFLGANMSLTPTRQSHIFMGVWQWGRYLGDEPLRIITSTFCRPHPHSCHIEAKVVGHYTNSILATTEAKEKGYDEALLLDVNGYVAEGSGANFFYERDGKLYTPPLGNILPGITRSTVFDIAEEKGIEVVEKLFTKDEIYQADYAFFTGTATEVAGIGELDQHKFEMDWEDTLGYIIASAYRKLARQDELQYCTVI